MCETADENGPYGLNGTKDDAMKPDGRPQDLKLLIFQKKVIEANCAPKSLHFYVTILDQLWHYA